MKGASLGVFSPASLSFGPTTITLSEGPSQRFIDRVETNSPELWSRDAQGDWTQLGQRAGGPFSARPLHLMGLGDDRVLFFADDGLHGWEPWLADGRGAAMLADLTPGGASSWPVELEVYGRSLVCFTLQDKRRLCTDGTKQGSRKMPSKYSWPLANGIVSLVAEGGAIMLKDERGAALMRVEASSLEDEYEDEYADESMPPRADKLFDAYLPHLIDGRMAIAVSAGDMYRQLQILVSDGSKQGTRLVAEPGSLEVPSDFGPRMTSYNVVRIRRSSDAPLRWIERRPDGGWEWTSDGSIKGTKQLKQIGREESERFADRDELDVAGARVVVDYNAKTITWPSKQGAPRVYKHKAMTMGRVLAGPRALWWSEVEQGRAAKIMGWRQGAAEPEALFDLSRGMLLSWQLAPHGDLWLFAAPDASHSVEQAQLWYSDGTKRGTREMIPPQGRILGVPSPVATEAGLYLSIDHPEHGAELFLWPVSASK